MTDQPSLPTNEPTPTYAYEPATVPAAAAVHEPPPAPSASGSHRTWWIVGGIVGGLALWAFGFVGGVAASAVFDGGHDFEHGSADMHQGQLPFPGGMPGDQVPEAPMPGAPDFDDEPGTVPEPGDDESDS